MRIELVFEGECIATYDVSAAPGRGDLVSLRSRLDDKTAKRYRVERVSHVIHELGSTGHRGRGGETAEHSGAVVYLEAT